MLKIIKKWKSKWKGFSLALHSVGIVFVITKKHLLQQLYVRGIVWSYLVLCGMRVWIDFFIIINGFTFQEESGHYLSWNAISIFFILLSEIPMSSLFFFVKTYCQFSGYSSQKCNELHSQSFFSCHLFNATVLVIITWTYKKL